MREYGEPSIAPDPSRGSLLDPLAERAAAQPSSTALMVSRLGRWAPVSCEQLLDEVCTIAKGIAAAGVQPGDRIAIQSRNRVEWLVAEYAIWQAGAISVPVPPSAPPDQLDWVLSDSGAVGLFAGTAGGYEGFARIRRRLTGVRHVWVFDDGALWSLAESGQIVGDDDLELRRARLGPGSPATISYALGRADRPPGALLSHSAMGHQVETLARCLAEVFHEEASLLTSLPLHDPFGRILQLAAVRSGVPSGVCDGLELLEEFGRFRPSCVVTSADLLGAIIERARVNASRSGLGRMFDRAAGCAVRFGHTLPRGAGLRLRLEHAAFGPLVFRNLRDDLGGRLDCLILHDLWLDPDLAAFYAGLGIDVLRGHGTPEASGASHLNLPNAALAGSMGRPLPGTATRISSDGEVLLRGPGLFDGYWNDEAATLAVTDGDGWFATGDVGVLDDEGFLHLLAHRKQIAAHPAWRARGRARD